jgi:ABC-type sugar transport system permease subunit
MTTPRDIYARSPKGELNSVQARRRFRLTYRHQEELWGYLFLAPTIIGLLAFTLGPALASIALAFFSTNFVTDTHWVGLGNFQEMLGDSTFWTSVRNTLVYVGGHIVPTVLLSMGLAVALNQPIRARSFFRTLYFLPIVAPVVATTLVWAWAYHSEFGIFNYIVRLLGFDAIPWLTDSSWALPSVIIWSIWAGLGYSVILFLAALQNVPREQVEASKLDGASAWQTFRYITFAAISPTTFFVVVLQFIGSFQVFTEMYVMTQGGPGYSTYTVIYYLYLTGWNAFRYGYASAVAVFLFVVLATITFLQFRIQSRWVHYEHD